MCVQIVQFFLEIGEMVRIMRAISCRTICWYSLEGLVLLTSTLFLVHNVMFPTGFLGFRVFFWNYCILLKF